MHVEKLMKLEHWMKGGGCIKVRYWIECTKVNESSNMNESSIGNEN